MADIFRKLLAKQCCRATGLHCPYDNTGNERHRGTAFCRTFARRGMNKIARAKLKAIDRKETTED